MPSSVPTGLSRQPTANSTRGQKISIPVETQIVNADGTEMQASRARIGGQNAAIACRYPLPEELEHHFRMLAENGTPMLVVLASQGEMDDPVKRMPPYFKASKKYGNIHVSSEHTGAVTLPSGLQVEHYNLTIQAEDGKSVSIPVRHVTNWPDGRAPQPGVLQELVTHLDREGQFALFDRSGDAGREKGLPVVHCRAGVDRTGMLLAAAARIQRPDLKMETIVADFRETRWSDAINGQQKSQLHLLEKQLAPAGEHGMPEPANAQPATTPQSTPSRTAERNSPGRPTVAGMDDNLLMRRLALLEVPRGDEVDQAHVARQRGEPAGHALSTQDRNAVDEAFQDFAGRTGEAILEHAELRDYLEGRVNEPPVEGLLLPVDRSSSSEQQKEAIPARSTTKKKDSTRQQPETTGQDQKKAMGRTQSGPTSSAAPSTGGTALVPTQGPPSAPAGGGGVPPHSSCNSGEGPGGVPNAAETKAFDGQQDGITMPPYSVPSSQRSGADALASQTGARLPPTTPALTEGGQRGAAHASPTHTGAVRKTRWLERFLRFCAKVKALVMGEPMPPELLAQSPSVDNPDVQPARADTPSPAKSQSHERLLDPQLHEQVHDRLPPRCEPGKHCPTLQRG